MRRCSPRGFLLVEAVLCAVIIAAGLLFIARALGAQLSALRTLEARDTLMTLARSKLLELEGKMLGRHLLAVDQHGTFPEPYTAYQWTILVVPREDLLDEHQTSWAGQVTLTVQREGASGSTNLLQIHAIWPSQWMPTEWLTPAS